VFARVARRGLAGRAEIVVVVFGFADLAGVERLPCLASAMSFSSTALRNFE